MATDWTAFGAFAVVVTLALVALTRQSAAMLADDAAPDLSSTALLANTTASQAVVGALLVAVGWATGVPASAVSPGVSVDAVAVGVGAGVALAAGNEATMRALDAAGLSYDSSLRDALAPDSLAGWALLLGVALPAVAGFEELLFRGVLVGAFATGFGVDPWLLVVPASVAFGAAHTAQGFTGVVVASLLGLALCAVYLGTGSLLAPVVAHYVVNAVEFVVHGQ
ncbi:CPBP family intramembrane glutamic endopeptidase [Halobacterium litoreum]|uniref:CPBP family intramembrane glutamic endopeptidase n=1 Tax=Halobacterium litoreum TaxID=2039234 RepID=A0ABD5NGF0_9EURY|nr:CPBP family intramembrane glutamic endopeptidase [Halobacterium litoreum]UHH12737.1 CPBP family intramembrane metalloprotease [Halobacterium litoreum]